MSGAHLFFHSRSQSCFPFDFLLVNVMAVAFIVLGGYAAKSDGGIVSIQGRPTFSSKESVSAKRVPVNVDSLTYFKVLMDSTSTTTKLQRVSSSKPVSMLKDRDVHSSMSTFLPITSVATSRAYKGNTLKGMSEMEVQRELQLMINTLSANILIAQCRATCLAKLLKRNRTKDKSPFVKTLPRLVISTSEQPVAQAGTIIQQEKLMDQDNQDQFTRFIDPQGSPECDSCWKNCQDFAITGSATLLSAGGDESIIATVNKPEVESRLNKPWLPSLSAASSTEKNDDDEIVFQLRVREERKQDVVYNKLGNTASQPEDTKITQSTFSCFQQDGNQNSQQLSCTGCQVACSFYYNLSTSRNSEKRNGLVTIPKTATSDKLFLAIKQAGVVKVLPGKITWPAEFKDETNNESKINDPVVYVVIQKFPGGKWKQLVQTTHTEIGIATKLTAAMKTKLRSILVLVVGSQGLRSVYTATTISESVSSGEENQPTFKETGTSNGNETRTEMSAAVYDNAKLEKQKEKVISSTRDVKTNPQYNFSESEIYPNATSVPIPGELFDETLFTLRLVSLLHQNSLVIAEVKWEEIRNNSKEEYLITWELVRGGLKGHLVTESTSVTLSLWPDTLYKIQVECHLQTEEGKSHSTKQTNNTASHSRTSSPLVVNTSAASFPLKVTYAHRRSPERSKESGDWEEEDYDGESKKDEIEEKDNDNGYELPSSEISFGKILGVTLLSFVVVLGMFSLVAFAWARLRLLSGSQAFVQVESVCCSVCEQGLSCCFCLTCAENCGKIECPTRLVGSQESVCSNESADLCQSPSLSSYPLHSAFSLKKSQYCAGQRKKSCLSGMSGQRQSFHAPYQIPGDVTEPLDAQSTSSPTAACEEIPVAIISNAWLPSLSPLEIQSGVASEYYRPNSPLSRRFLSDNLFPSPNLTRSLAVTPFQLPEIKTASR